MARFYGHLVNRTDFQLRLFQGPRLNPLESISTDLETSSAHGASPFGSVTLAVDSPQPLLGEVILAAYRQWGIDCVHHLPGEFAFALWDPDKQVLLAARDPLGLRPLYYADCEADIYLGSFPDVIRKCSHYDWSLDETRIADYLVGTREGANLGRSFYRGIRSLPPGSRLVLRQGQINVEPYWEFQQPEPLQFVSEASATAAFHDLLQEVVSDSIQPSVPTAAMLSGGLDSSLLACVANPIVKSVWGRELAVFSGVTNLAVDCPDPYFTRYVTQTLALDQCAIVSEELDTYTPELTGYYSDLGEPFDADMTLVAISYLAARKAGYKAVIDGVDGDLVGSLSDQYLGILLRRLEFATLRDEFFSMGKIWSEEVNLLGLFRYTLLPDLVPQFLSRIKRRLSASQFARTLGSTTLLSSKFARDSGLLGQLEIESKSPRAKFPATMAEVHLRRVDSPALTAGIERYGRVAAACGVERISPLLDLRVVEFMLSLPWQYKVRRGQSKFLFRQLLREYGLDELATRHDKYGLGWHFTRQWMSLNADRDRLLVEQEEGRLEAYLDMDEYRLAKANYFENNLGDDVRMWRVIHLLRWLANQDRS